MNIAEVSNGLFYSKGILKTGSSVIQRIRDQFGLNKRTAFNQIEVDEKSITARLFDRHGNCALIDQDDIEDVIRLCAWTASPNRSGEFYFVGYNGNFKTVRLHQFVMRKELEKYAGFTEATGLQIVVNHINGNTLDNRRCNLEVVTQSENAIFESNKIGSNNKTGFKGVSWIKERGKFVVLVARKYHGYYETIEEAAAIAKQARQDELKRLQQLRLEFLKERGFMS